MSTVYWKWIACYSVLLRLTKIDR